MRSLEKQMRYVFLKEVLTGTVVGLVVFATVIMLNLPLPLLVVAPFISGLVIGKTKRGVLSGTLTALIPILIIIALLVGALTSYDPNLPSSITLSGNPFGAIVQAILLAVVGGAFVGIGALFLIIALVLVGNEMELMIARTYGLI